MSEPARAAVYLDHAAATPLRPEVAEAMAEAAARGYANPSSPHAAGRLAKTILEESRERILALAGGRGSGQQRDRLVFTSGATEANRLGLLGSAGGVAGWVGTSARDHPSLRRAAADLETRGWEGRDIPLTAVGGLNAAAIGPLGTASGGRPSLLAVTTVCGQTGILEDQEAIARLVRDDSRLVVHADATQEAAWQILQFGQTPFATLAFAPHKFGGPRGIGGLLIRSGTVLRPLTPGPQELGLRGGSEAVSLAVGFARSLEVAVAEQAAAAARVARLRDRFERRLLGAARDAGLAAAVIGAGCPRAPHIAAVGIRGVDRQALVMAADVAGLCLATGTACASGASEPPAVLRALGIDPALGQGVIRASFGVTTTENDVDHAIASLTAIFSRFRN